MLYLFAGDDAKTKILSYEKFLESNATTNEKFYISRNNFNRLEIESLYSGAGLFFSKAAVIFSDVLEREETREFILDKLGEMDESASMFIFLEGKLGKPVIDSFKKSRAEINVFELPKEKKEKYDNFLVANAFASRDKLNIWIHFRRAMDLGVGMEEIVGVLFWKIKDMLVRKNFSKFTEKELQNSAARLSYLLPEARAKGIDAESAFEQFLLEVY